MVATKFSGGLVSVLSSVVRVILSPTRAPPRDGLSFPLFLPLWSNERPTTRSPTAAITPPVNGLAVVRLFQLRFSEDDLSLLHSFGETLSFPILSELTPAGLASQAPIPSRGIRVQSWFPTSTSLGRLFYFEA